MNNKKKTYRSLVHGDVLIYKIKNYDKKFDGRHLVYIKYNPEDWEKYDENNYLVYPHNNIFCVAITNKGYIPNVETILNNIEYIPMECYYFEKDTVEIVYGKKYKYLIPDEYGFYYCFLKELKFSTKSERNLDVAAYLGNIPDYKPKNLFIYEQYHGMLFDNRVSNVFKTFLERYQRYVVEKASYFTDKEIKDDKRVYFLRLVKEKNKIRMSLKNSPSYDYGTGPSIYDSEIAMDVKTIFDVTWAICEEDDYIHIMNLLWPPCCDYILNDNDNFFIVYIVLADLFLKKGRMDENLKNIGLDIIEDDLEYNWKGQEDYNRRKEILQKLYNDLLIFEPNEINWKTGHCFRRNHENLNKVILKCEYHSRFNYNQSFIELVKGSINGRIYNPGWGVGLYDSDTALDVKGIYQSFLKESKRTKETHKKMLKKFIDYNSDIIEDEFDGPIFWITLANEELKRKLLTKKIRDKALKSIKKDIKNWKEYELYEERKKVLNDLKERLEEYKIEE